ATLLKPPNHKLFDCWSSPVSPVLQCRLENARAVAAVPSAPVFNISIGKDVVDLFRPSATPIAPVLLPAYMPQPVLNHDMSNLLPHSRIPGPDMPLGKFCKRYNLGANVLARFTENFYKEACVLCFVMVDQLKEMGFCLGEIAGLHDVVNSW
ncbi:hypothetical protein L208DRAFT_1176794, partial [Tricholoma matsutake]